MNTFDMFVSVEEIYSGNDISEAMEEINRETAEKELNEKLSKGFTTKTLYVGIHPEGNEDDEMLFETAAERDEYFRLLYKKEKLDTGCLFVSYNDFKSCCEFSKRTLIKKVR